MRTQLVVYNPRGFFHRTYDLTPASQIQVLLDGEPIAQLNPGAPDALSVHVVDADNSHLQHRQDLGGQG